MKRLVIASAAALTMLLAVGVSPALAVFSVSADIPVQYTFAQSKPFSDFDNEFKSTAADSVSGYKLAVNLPFFFGVAMENYTVSGTIEDPVLDDIALDVGVSFYDIFLDLPLPLLNVSAGYGVGTATVDLDVSGLEGDDASLSQYFVTLGVPILVLFDVHLGYHVVSGASDLSSGGSDIGDLTLDGNMLSLGVRAGF